MNNKKSEEIQWVNTLKGGCILLVVLPDGRQPAGAYLGSV